MLEGWFLWVILFWVVFLMSMFAIGGFFMFRKFFQAAYQKKTACLGALIGKTLPFQNRPPLVS